MNKVLSVWDIARTAYEAQRSILLSVRDPDTGLGIPPHWEELTSAGRYDQSVRWAYLVLNDTGLIFDVEKVAQAIHNSIRRELNKFGVTWGPTAIPNNTFDGFDDVINTEDPDKIQRIIRYLQGATHPYAGEWEQLPYGEQVGLIVFADTADRLRRWRIK